MTYFILLRIARPHSFAATLCHLRDKGRYLKEEHHNNYQWRSPNGLNLDTSPKQLGGLGSDVGPASVQMKCCRIQQFWFISDKT